MLRRLSVPVLKNIREEMPNHDAIEQDTWTLQSNLAFELAPKGPAIATHGKEICIIFHQERTDLNEPVFTIASLVVIGLGDSV